MSLTPEIIQERSINGNMSRNDALRLLTVFIENSENESLRLKSLKALNDLEFKSENIYSLLEHLVISDENEEVRCFAGKNLILHFSKKGIKPILWAIENESSYRCLSSFFEALGKVEHYDFHEVIVSFFKNFLHRAIKKRNKNS